MREDGLLTQVPTTLSGDVIVPATVADATGVARQVTMVGNEVFSNCPQLTGVTLPEGVKNLWWGAFHNSPIQRVTLPASLEEIGNWAFRGCPSLEWVTIPSGTTQILEYAFADCPSLRGFDVAPGNTAFRAEADGRLLLSADGTHLVACAAADNDGTITLTASVSAIDNFALAGCAGLTDIRVAPDNNSLKSEDGLLLTADGKRLVCCLPSKSGALALPEGLTTIGERAFDECSRLTSVALPASFTSDISFPGCPSLSAITVAEGNGKYKSANGLLLTADGKQLVRCPQNRSGALALPEGLTSIGEMAFNGCSGLTSISLPEGLTSIGQRAFNGCSGLTSISLPEGLTSIGQSAFNGCENLEQISVAVGNPDYKSADGLLLNADGTKLVRCPCGKSGHLTLPEGLTSIGDRAFSGCSGITDIELPAKLTCFIYSDTFNGCENLEQISVAEGNPDYKSADGLLLTAGGTQLVCCPRGKSGPLTLPTGITWTSRMAFDGCSKLTLIALPEGLTTIGDYAFNGCSSVTRIELPASLTSDIDGRTFNGCQSLTEITVATGNKKYKTVNGLLLTADGTELVCCPPGKSGALALPDGLTTIGDQAFYGGSGISRIELPASLTASSIGQIINSCHSLQAITVAEGNSAYKSADGLLLTADGTKLVCCPPGKSGALVLPEGLTSIGDGAFRGCSRLTEITLPESLTSIGEEAFRSCSRLTEITLPESLTSIGGRAFSSCSELTEITLPAGLTSIGEDAFRNCPSLAKVHIINTSGGPLSEQEKAAYVAKLGLPEVATVEWSTTALPAVQAPEKARRTHNGTYDLSGRRAGAGQRGLLIDNGRLRLHRPR